MDNNIKMFTYGSLREGFFNYNKYLKGNVISNKIAKIKNVSLYHMPYKEYPAVIDGNDKVIGEVMELSNYDEVFREVDEMEGFISEGNPNNEYNKVLVQVEYEDGSKENCYSYIYNKNIDDKFTEEAIYLKTGDWKEYMLNKK